MKVNIKLEGFDEFQYHLANARAAAANAATEIGRLKLAIEELNKIELRLKSEMLEAKEA